MSDSLKVGDMRIYVKAMRKNETKSGGGQIIHGWEYGFSFYAALDNPKTTESSVGLMQGARTTVNLTTWLRDDIKRDMRIVYDEEEYSIVSLAKGFKTMNLECTRVE